MSKEDFRLIKQHDRTLRSSYSTKKYIKKGLDAYSHNEDVSRSKVINKLLEQFLIVAGYIDKDGRVIIERVF